MIREALFMASGLRFIPALICKTASGDSPILRTTSTRRLWRFNHDPPSNSNRHTRHHCQRKADALYFRPLQRWNHVDDRKRARRNVEATGRDSAAGCGWGSLQVSLFDYIRKTYKVPAKRGGRIKMQGRPGRILSSNGTHLRIKFDDGRKGYVHPTWEMVYE